jgi:hypothetical protein
MAGGPYDAGFTAPDIGPGAALIASVLNSNRANERADEYARMQREAMDRSAERESAEEKRKDEETKRRHQIEAFTQLPLLQRAALRSMKETGSPGYAAANPYGINFAVEQGEGPSLRKAGINVMGGNEQYAQQAAGDLATHGQIGTEGEPLQLPEEPPHAAQALLGQHSGMGQAPMGQHAPTMVTEPGEPPHDETAEAEGGLERAQELLAQPRSNKLYATYEGQRFEVPQQSDKTPFGPEYDAIFGGLIDAGEDPHKAMALVAAQYKADQVEKGRASRLVDTLDFRAKNREDQQEFTALQNKLYRNEPLTNAEREKLVQLGGQFRVAAAAPGLKADAANARDMSLLERAGSAVRQTGQFNKLAASDKTVRTIMVNIANGTTPLQHKDAQIQLARFFRQAQPTEGEMHILYNNLGGTMDKWNQFVARMQNGDLSAEQLRQMRLSAKAVQSEHGEDVRRFMNVAKARLGPGGGFDLMPDQAQKLYESLGAELGIEGLPPLYTTEGGVTLGSGKRPTTQPRGTKKTALDQIEEQLDALGSQ